jgi:putative copper resistance protein D
MELMGLLRGGHVAGTLSLFGSLGFLALIVPPGARAALRLRGWLVASLAAALGFGSLWLLAVVAEVAGDAGPGAAWAALPAVLTRTEFGRNSLFRAVLLLATGAIVLIGPRFRFAPAAACVAGLAVVLLAGVGHAAALPPAEALLPSLVETLHLLAAGLWLGGLVPLLLALRLPASEVVVRRFSRLGAAAVALLALTAVGNAVLWVGSLSALIDSAYGRWVLAKLALFVAMLALAAVNRWRLTPALAGHAPEAARRRLRRSIAAEAMLGLAIVAAAGMLASTAPPTHHF